MMPFGDIDDFAASELLDGKLVAFGLFKFILTRSCSAIPNELFYFYSFYRF